MFSQFGERRRIQNSVLNQIRLHAWFIVEHDLLEDSIPLAKGIADVAAENGDVQFLGASFLANALRKLERQNLEDENREFRRLVSEQAVEMLDEAVTMGFNKSQLLNREPWQSFSQKPAFQRVLERLE